MRTLRQSYGYHRNGRTLMMQRYIKVWHNYTSLLAPRFSSVALLQHPGGDVVVRSGLAGTPSASLYFAIVLVGRYIFRI